MNCTRRKFVKSMGIGLAAMTMPGCGGAMSKTGRAETPNFIVIFCDDLGYGDVGCFGSKLHRTPNIDRMAREGVRFTSFYVTSGVCTPSRSSLMTGCYPRRVNMHVDSKGRGVLFPVDKKGLNPNEITIAEVLKGRGYATTCIGKWHLGDQKEFLPTRQGFDSYYGIPYSNDMGVRKNSNRPPLPLLRNETVIESPVDQNTITKRYAQEAVRFIEANKERPFFIYLPHAMPHNPVHSSDAFRGKSANKGYGDCVEEIDFTTGQILASLKQNGIDDKTLVIFTSDNGASRSFGGSNLPLSGWKGSTMEGGMREPCIMRWPGRIPAGTACDEIASTLDILPTVAKLAGTNAPSDRIIDGRDIWPLMCSQKGAKSPHEAFYYYWEDQLQAVRSGRWKLVLPFEKKKRNWGKPEPNMPLQLFDLNADIAEKNSLADQHPEIVEKLMVYIRKARADLGDQQMQGAGQRPAGLVVSPVPLTR